jgi:hypothetical protein
MSQPKKSKKEKEEDKKFPLPPSYEEKDDIYTNEKKVPVEDEEEDNIDLDIPGAELDDAGEKIGSEDEENNYYSLGGDNHGDLEEDKD